MSKTLATLQNEVLRALGLPSNSNIAVTPGGVTSGTNTYTTAQSLTDYINEAADQLCRTAYLLMLTGTVAITAGDRTKDLSALTLSGARFMRAAWRVQYTPSSGPSSGVASNLPFLDWNRLLNYYPTYDLDGNGTPAYYYEVAGGDPTIGIYPPPSVNGSVSVTGFCQPTYLDATVPTGTLTWLSDQWNEAIVFYAADCVSIQAAENPMIEVRLPSFKEKWQRLFLQIRSEQDPVMADLYLDPIPSAAAPPARTAAK